MQWTGEPCRARRGFPQPIAKGGRHVRFTRGFLESGGSGPIVEKLKLNPGTDTAGGENPVTNALGYFVNFVGDVVGGSVPPNFDKSTHGSSADLVAMVFTENAKENPWKTT